MLAVHKLCAEGHVFLVNVEIGKRRLIGVHGVCAVFKLPAACVVFLLPVSVIYRKIVLETYRLGHIFGICPVIVCCTRGRAFEIYGRRNINAIGVSIQSQIKMCAKEGVHCIGKGKGNFGGYIEGIAVNTNNIERRIICLALKLVKLFIRKLAV